MSPSAWFTRSDLAPCSRSSEPSAHHRTDRRFLRGYSDYLFSDRRQTRQPARRQRAAPHLAVPLTPLPHVQPRIVQPMGPRLELGCVAHSRREVYVTTKLWLYAMCGLAAVPSVVAHAADDTGASLYLNHCAACHGASGEGGGPVAVAMSITIPNLRSLSDVTAVFFPPTRLPLTSMGASSRQLTAIGTCRLGRRVSRARARHCPAHSTPSRRRTRGVPRDTTVSLAGAGKAPVTNESRQITVGVLPTKLLEQRHRLRLADPAEAR